MAAKPRLVTPAFEGEPKARADLHVRTLYAVSGEGGWIYYGQATPAQKIGLFHYRARELEWENAARAPVMAVVSVSIPSITRALRSGRWRKLGRVPLAPALERPTFSVQWLMDTITIAVWNDFDGSGFETRVDDPAAQQLEVAAAWDAEYHIPERLTADFGLEPAEWHVGGPLWRERRVAEERARRFAGQPGAGLPEDYLFLSR